MRERTRSVLTVAASIGGVAVVAALIGALSEPPAAEGPSRAPSVFYSDPSGARALFLVVERLLPSAEPWRRPLTQLPDPGPPCKAGTTLFVAGPSEGLSAEEADALDAWVSAGGQVVLALDRDWEVRGGTPGFLARHGVSVEGRGEGEEVLHDVKAAAIADEPLRLGFGKGCRVRGPGLELARDGKDVLVHATTHGRGRVVVLPDASFVANAALRGSDNAVLLVLLASRWESRRVLFDEVHHGFGEARGLLALSTSLFRTPWGWGLATLAAAGAIYVLGCRRRFGRVRDPAAPSRETPMGTIDGRAGLFRVAGAGGMAIELFCTELEREASLALGRSTDLAEMARAAGGAGRAARLLAIREAAREGRFRVGEAEVVEASRLAGGLFKELALG